jgi:hypothetical protein
MQASNSDETTDVESSMRGRTNMSVICGGRDHSKRTSGCIPPPGSGGSEKKPELKLGGRLVRKFGFRERGLGQTFGIQATTTTFNTGNSSRHRVCLVYRTAKMAANVAIMMMPGPEITLAMQDRECQH